MKHQSLAHYLNRRYLLILALIIAAFTALISFMNWSGMDDTTEYYMFYEAEVLTEHYQPNQTVVEFDSGRKEYYWGKNNLPARYIKLIEEDNIELDEASLFFVENQYIYILPFSLPALNTVFYVIHIFSQDDYAKSNQSVRLSLSFVSFLLFVLLIFLVTRLNRKVTDQINLFDRWMTKISEQSANAYPDTAIPEKINFRELVKAASRLKTSLQSQYELRQIESERVKREKDFLSSLSHELRTPISVIAAAIAVLKKRNQLSEKDAKVLDKLARANSNMKLMTGTLLQVWRKQKSANEPVNLVLSEQLAHLVEESEVYCSATVQFHLDICSHEPIQADISLIEITLGNLLRNACQYTADNNVHISVTQSTVTVSNAFEQEHQHIDLNYGFGFGLYLVETICKQQNWQFTVDKNKNRFVVEIEFSEPVA
ncbi:sensor histidine kinase [Thalassotalea fusca]